MTAETKLREEIDAANQRFMQLFANNDIPGVAACYTDDAQLLVPHMDPVRGRAAIQAVFDVSAGKGHTLQITTLDLEGHGATAIDIGEYLRKQSDGQTLDRGKYLVIWKRAGGEWKIHRDMLSTSQPRPA
jgi:ketosteroid isomerase-like protein